MIQAVLLTHTHSDHWRDRTLAYLARLRIPLYCHESHHAALLRWSGAFGQLLADGLVRPFAAGDRLELAPGVSCRPFAVRHDAGATFGFRLEGPADLFGRAPALAYAADLGCWDDELVAHLADVDLLALEFNHDVGLERASGRAEPVIARVLGDEGHLSNDQAAALVREVLRRSTAGRLQHLVQLHLSRQCNRPALARESARAVLAELVATARLHTSSQDEPSATLLLHDGAAPRRPAASRRAGRQPGQPCLPGLDEIGKLGT
jgi:phosphoribosyl 1,2-cyclic phosphodiesterase